MEQEMVNTCTRCGKISYDSWFPRSFSLDAAGHCIPHTTAEYDAYDASGGPVYCSEQCRDQAESEADSTETVISDEYQVVPVTQMGTVCDAVSSGHFIIECDETAARKCAIDYAKTCQKHDKLSIWTYTVRRVTTSTIKF
jgi:hypothetical protein